MKAQRRGSSMRYATVPNGRWKPSTDEFREVRLAVVTVAASFAATFGYLWWQHGPFWRVTEPADRQTAVPVARTPMPEPISALPRNAPPAEPAVPPVAAAPAAPAAVSSANLDGPALPVLASFATFAAHNNAAESIEAGGVDESVRDQLDILNTSDQLLAVTVIDVNPTNKKTASTQVLLTPNGQAHINPDSGLPLASGDAVTLRSSGFRDMSQSAP